jgi:hypothetical protein
MIGASLHKISKTFFHLVEETIIDTLTSSQCSSYLEIAFSSSFSHGTSTTLSLLIAEGESPSTSHSIKSPKSFSISQLRDIWSKTLIRRSIRLMHFNRNKSLLVDRGKKYTSTRKMVYLP